MKTKKNAPIQYRGPELSTGTAGRGTFVLAKKKNEIVCLDNILAFSRKYSQNQKKKKQKASLARASAVLCM